jgi:hypothetical protein
MTIAVGEVLGSAKDTVYYKPVYNLSRQHNEIHVDTSITLYPLLHLSRLGISLGSKLSLLDQSRRSISSRHVHFNQPQLVWFIELGVVE